METNIIVPVHCSWCRKELEAIDLVAIDELNYLTHIQCTTKTDTPLKDLGYYQDIVEKYHYSKE
ncbi:hypothetical protein [Peribacillus sp. SCS-155]|uniref:hypothetical protein n=1 Tax=Peribacillus sedimenti TaxID=3115297 RepID=UPI003905A951